MTPRFAGKVAIVAGGAGGIGAEICRQFNAAGATVICADRSLPRAEAFVTSYAHSAAPIVAAHLDATSSSSWQALAASTVERCGRIDILVTAVYSGPTGSVEDMPDEHWNASFAATSSGVFYGMRTCAAFMGNGAAIVNIASILAHGGAADNIGYSSAKASVIAMSRAAASKLAPRGIRVNVVTPGYIQTWALDATIAALAGTSQTPEELKKSWVERVPLKSIGQPADVAHAVLFLAGETAAYITGAEIIVDGGLRSA
jgi:NAD(P)-dependent dehydrogenase (short-subunit alcohol dehydrogenase family)